MNSRIRTALLLITPVLAIPVLAYAATASDAWAEHCARCHAADGTGSTKVGKKLKVEDYTKADVQAKMTDEVMLKAIRDGAFDANKKERMPAYKDKLSEDEMKELVGYIRKMKK